MNESTAMTLKTVNESIERLEVLEKIKSTIPEMSTQDLGIAYTKLKPFENGVKDIVKAMRDNIVEVRFNTVGEPVEEDAKGNKVMKLEDGSKLTLQKKTVKEFSDKTAIEVATMVGANDLILDKDVTIVDQVAFLDALKYLRINCAGTGLYSLCEKLASSLVITEKVNEDKFNALAVLGKVTPEQMDLVYNKKTQYALTIPRK